MILIIASDPIAPVLNLKFVNMERESVTFIQEPHPILKTDFYVDQALIPETKG